MKTRAHVFVSGRVQGVFFREETRKLAIKHNVTGWIRNTYDGRVEAVFEGEKENVEKLVDFCRSGPLYSKVTNIEVTQEEFVGEFRDFTIHH